MQYIVHIPDQNERYAFAAKIKKILKSANIKAVEYIPGNKNKILKSDIGIKANGIDKKILAQVLSQVERRGYTLLRNKTSK